MTSLPEQSNSDFADEVYPEGMAWRCEVCRNCIENDDDRCEFHPEASMVRTNRRIRWGPLASMTRDVVVEHR